MLPEDQLDRQVWRVQIFDNEPLDLAEQELAGLRAYIFALGIDAERDFERGCETFEGLRGDFALPFGHGVEDRFPLGMNDPPNQRCRIDQLIRRRLVL